MNYKPCRVLVLLDSNHLLPLPKKLHLGYIVDVDVCVSILLCLELGVQELVLASGDTIHHLLVGHKLVDTLEYHVDILYVHS